MKTRDFTIIAKISLECDLVIQASCLEDALKKSETLELKDFVEEHGSLMDYDMHINGLFEG